MLHEILHAGKFFVICCCLLIFFQNQLFSKNSFGNTIRVSKQFGPRSVPTFVGSDMSPNCLQRLSSDNTSR